MSDKQQPAVKLVLCWHMHQPQYLDPSSGQYRLPWTYLHAIKDYIDMAAHLETTPGARSVVNFTPTLIEQIEDYALQVRDFLDVGRPINDPLLDALANPVLPDEVDERIKLAETCLKANHDRLIAVYPRFQLLADIVVWVRDRPECADYFNDQFLADILVWYHIAWMGETVRRGDPRIIELMDKGHNFTLRDRRLLMAVIGDLLSGVLGRYRKLAEDGIVELSMTPYAHPIMPLMLDIESARDAIPNVLLPGFEHYPGGEERVRWHIEHGLEVFERVFGFRPAGCWPSEGSISEATVRLLDDYGFKWTASGETVLANSLTKQYEKDVDGIKQWLHMPYSLFDTSITGFFRDDGLSDAIGFEYHNWHGDDAVSNFVNNVISIADQCGGGECNTISVILDGENAWESYPANAYYFLSALFRELVDHPRIELTTFQDIVNNDHIALPLTDMIAGSWVYGTFSTWIGDSDKNRGWEMLNDAKRCFDLVMKKGGMSAERQHRIERQLAICEGSDWCWWFGDYNPEGSVSDFERLYRRQLVTLYQLMGETPPDYLSHSFTKGSGAPATGGVMRMGKADGNHR
jgi:alpha-amylase/alpha-mannosidase (GH57 family)